MPAAPPPASPASEERRRLGRYELITPLGRGGMATVYLARMHGTAGFNRLVAVKLLLDELLDEPQLVTMFLDEARLAARIRHPNVVEVYDVETIGSELAIIMRWVEGASLSALQRALPVDEPMPLPLATRLVHDTLLGLHAAHELETDDGQPAGLVHRDVSPPNILVAIDGTVLLSDFGIATAAGRLRSTAAHVIRGKLAYMSPEQLEGGPLDRRTDVFAAGIVLWELLTGQRLFAAPSDDVLVKNVLQMPIAPPGSLRLGIPIALDEVVLCALERDKARRFATAAAFAEALEEACGGAMMDTREVGKLVSAKLSGAIERHRAALRRASPEVAAAAALASTLPEAPTMVSPLEGSPVPVPVPASPPAPARKLLAPAIAGATMLVVGLALAFTLSRTTASPDPSSSGSTSSGSPLPTTPAAVVTPITPPTAEAPTAHDPAAVATPAALPDTAQVPVASSRPSGPRRPGPHRPGRNGGGASASAAPPGAFVPTEP